MTHFIAAKDKKILLVGGGKMGRALLSGWIKKKFSRKNILVAEPIKRIRDSISETYKVKCSASGNEIIKFHADIIVFAIKPQDMATTLPLYKNSKAVFISIAAGISIDTLKKYLGEDAKIVRTMPNLPATIMEGITVGTVYNLKGKNYTAVSELFKAVGGFHTADERALDYVTAISGSGPGYFYDFAESIVKAGENLGLEKNFCHELVMQTLKGSALLASKSDKSFATLRDEVRSKGGTTDAALKVFEKGKALENLVDKGVRAAYERSKELSK